MRRRAGANPKREHRSRRLPGAFQVKARVGK
jgi:hypothetical protein